MPTAIPGTPLVGMSYRPTLAMTLGTTRYPMAIPTASVVRGLKYCMTNSFFEGDG